MTDTTGITDRASPGANPDVADDPPAVVVGLRRTRKVLWLALAVAVPMFVLVVILASGEPATQRAVRSPLVGKPAPPIEGTTIDGAPASLAALKGKWVVVNFFATWCVPCRLEHPELVRFSQAHEGVGDAAILGVIYSDNTQAVREFRDKEGGAWSMLTDPKGRIAIDYGVAGVPESFLVNPDGLVVAKLLGGVRAGGLDQLLYQAKTGQ